MVFSDLQCAKRNLLHAILLLCAGFTATPYASGQSLSRPQTPIERSPDTILALRYEFTTADAELLDVLEQGCFQYLWREVGAASGLVKDRRFHDVSSVAGVGFQLSSLPIGVERGWVSHAEAERRAVKILRTLSSRSDNRKFGVLLHFVDLENGGLLPGKQSEQASTVDHALFLAGALVAAEYFGGETAKLVADLADATNWRAYDVSEKGFISFGWRPTERVLSGPGDFRPWD
ncbi:MAG: hypothetical protein KDA61_14965, partial [Planctomycetales bacterium]|nr:hypothetical protein [Planctomycetales bacterium]